MKHQLRLSGTGGQGLITVGIILAEAALLDGKLAVQSQSYGPEARGGSSKAEVIISDETIHFGKVTIPDTLLAMSQEAANKFIAETNPDSITIIDSLFVQEIPSHKNAVYALPITHFATEEFGKALYANIVALGAIAELTQVVSKDALVKAVLARVPEGTEYVNQKALESGMELARNATAI